MNSMGFRPGNSAKYPNQQGVSSARNAAHNPSFQHSTGPYPPQPPAFAGQYQPASTPGPPTQGPPTGQFQGPPTGQYQPASTQGPPTGQFRATSIQGPPTGQFQGPPTQGPPTGQFQGPPTQGPPTGQFQTPPTGKFQAARGVPHQQQQGLGPPVGQYQGKGPPTNAGQYASNGPPTNAGQYASNGPPTNAGQYTPGGGAPPNAGYTRPPDEPVGNAPRSAARDPRQRIDPNQIPRPPIIDRVIGYTARGHTMTMPPPASSDFVVVDDGCCNPRFIRPTLNHIPQTKETAKKCGIPIAAIISPLASLHPEEERVPMVDFGPEGPLRCTRCKAYINSFSKFMKGGNAYKCNICGMVNETPRDYYCNMDEYGKRRDVSMRPELGKGSVDFLVPDAYTIRPPQQPLYVFVLDVSMFAAQNGLIQTALEAIKVSLGQLPNAASAQVGIMAFDRLVYYFKFEEALDTPRILVCPDINDPFSPIPSSTWLSPLDVFVEKFDALALLIANNFGESQVPEAATGSALFSACEALTQSGGRVLMVHTSLARIGVGKVKREENQRHYGTDHERPMYCADEKDTFYNQLAESCAKRQIVVDIFMCGKVYGDVATVGQVCTVTGGSFHFSPYFGKNPTEDKKQFQRELGRALNRTIGFEAVLKVRCSTGLRIKKHYGHYLSKLGSEIEVAGVDIDKSVVAIIEHDDDLDEDNDVFIQAALLYTSIDGRRCVRVHNLALQVAPLLSNIFRHADLEATCAIYQRQAREYMFDKNSIQTRELLIEGCVNVLFNYRKHCATASSTGQLILPESLKLLPLYTLATMKSFAVRSNLMGSSSRGIVDVRADERATMLMLFESLPVEHAVFAVYPRMYALHSMSDECGRIGDNGMIQLPERLPPTAEKLTEDGIFLLVTAVSMMIYISPNASDDVKSRFFGSSSLDSSEKSINLVEDDSDDYVDRIKCIIEEIREKSPIEQKLSIITKNDWRCGSFMNSLVEDRTKNDMSYVEFLCHLHKKIQAKFN